MAEHDELLADVRQHAKDPGWYPARIEAVMLADALESTVTALREADAENARLREDVANRDSRLRADIELMNIAGIDGPGAEKALADHDAAILAPLQAKLDAVKALAAEHWDWKAGRALADRLRAIVAGDGCMWEFEDGDRKFLPHEPADNGACVNCFAILNGEEPNNA